jgi:transcriptional regulator with XRE-family HTH domain
MSDMPIAVCKAARKLLRWSTAELAHRCGLGHQTIKNWESDSPKISRKMHVRHGARMQAEFLAAGIGFVIGRDGIIGCYLRDTSTTATIRRVDNPQESVISAV